jgi:hypothetical protein
MKPRGQNQAGPHRRGPSGEPIRADELLPWSALHDRLGWGSRTISKARAQGLRVLRFGGRQWVKGADIIAFLDAHPLAGVQGNGDQADGGPGQ